MARKQVGLAPSAPTDGVTKAQLDLKVGSDGSVLTMVKMTQAAYNALATKDANTVYYIVG
jgi:hypothetical protein